jgi:uncharacterized protein
MNEETTIYNRAAVIAEIARLQPDIGRTALMKYLYLLQEVKGIDLGYTFDLYSYGPFDSSVLSDISTVVSWGGAKQTICHYPSGIGYELSEGSNSAAVRDLAKEFLGLADDPIRWVIDSFSGKGAGEMELYATLVYVYQEGQEWGSNWTDEQVIDRTIQLKPRYTREQALAALAKLRSVGAVS